MWKEIRHNGELIRHTDIAEWLACTLNEIHASSAYTIVFDPKDNLYQGVAWVEPQPDIPCAPETKQVPTKQADHGSGVFCDE